MIYMEEAERRIEALEKQRVDALDASIRLSDRIEALEKVSHSPSDVTDSIAALERRIEGADPSIALMAAWRERAETAESRLTDCRKLLKASEADLAWLDYPFLVAMQRQLQAGAARPGRKRDDWREEGLEFAGEIQESMRRHVDKSMRNGALDDTGETHWAAIACNAMMAHALLQEKPNAQDK